MVEHFHGKEEVPGSIPGLGSRIGSFIMIDKAVNMSALTALQGMITITVCLHRLKLRIYR